MKAIRIIAALGMAALLSACASNVPLSPAGKAMLKDARLATAEETAPDYMREIAASNAGAQYGLIGGLMDAINNTSNKKNSNLQQIPIATYDPAVSIQAKMANRIGRYYGSTQGKSFDSEAFDTVSSAEDRAKLLQRRGGGSGKVILDVYTARFGTWGHGKSFGFGTERYTVTYTAGAMLVAAGSGEVLAQASCNVSSAALTLNEYMNRSGNPTDELLKSLEAECIANIEKGMAL